MTQSLTFDVTGDFFLVAGKIEGGKNIFLEDTPDVILNQRWLVTGGMISLKLEQSQMCRAAAWLFTETTSNVLSSLGEQAVFFFFFGNLGNKRHD